MAETKKSLGIQTGVFDPAKYEGFMAGGSLPGEEPELLTTPPQALVADEAEEAQATEAEEPFFNYDKIVERFRIETDMQDKLNEQTRELKYQREFENEAATDGLGDGFGMGVAPIDAGFEFEGQSGGSAMMLKKAYEEGDPDMRFAQPDYSIANPEEDTGDTSSTMRNVVNFIFSDEMGLMGMKWDAEGFDLSKDHFLHQVSEHPYATAFTLGAYMVPIGAAWMKGARIASRAAKLTDEATAAGKGLLGTKLRHRFDDHSKLVKELAFTEANDGRQLFSPGLADKLRFAPPDEVRKLMPEKQLRKILIGDAHDARFYELLAKAKSGQLNTVREYAAWGMWKGFGNKYFKALNEATKEQVKTLDDFFTKAQLGKYLAQVPTRLGDEGNEAVYKFWAGGSSYDDMAKKVGDESALWADSMRSKWTDLLKSQYDEGFIGDNTFRTFTDEFGGFHLPAIKKGTAGFEDLATTSVSMVSGKYGGLAPASKAFDLAKAVTGPTTLKRGKYLTRESVLEDVSGLITDPRALTTGGFIKDNMVFQTYRMFRDVLVDGMAGSPKSSQWIKSLDEVAGMPPYARENWLDIDKLDTVIPGLSNVMKRMVAKEAEKKGLDPSLYKGAFPAVDKALVEQFFGKEGSAIAASGNFTRALELLTAVHKTARTSLNPPTHMANLIGNFSMLAMAGMSPFSRQALNDGQVLTSAFTKIAKMANRSKADVAAGKTGVVFDSVDALMNKETLSQVFGKDRFIKGVGGEQIDLAEMFSDDLMKGMIEAAAFENIEGFIHLKTLLKKLDNAEANSWSDKALATVARSIAGSSEVPGIKKTLQTASSAYLAEDMIPKMMYAMKLSREGWGRDAIIREVGRRLPQYRDVGNLPQKTRRVIFPWITFPAEMARIMKNNMMDAPISTMAWLQGPELVRAAAYGTGIGPNFDEHEAAIDAAPPWGVKYQTAFVKEGVAPKTLGAVGAGTIGGAVGGAVGGAKGAAIGVAAGAAAGAGIGALSPRSKELADQDGSQEGLRSWMLDALPHSALFPGSLHPNEWAKANPFSETPVPGAEWMKTTIDLSPVEPFSVVMPLLELYQGRGSFGKELESAGPGIVNKLAMGLMGFLAPPMVQKYGMKLENPKMGLVDMAQSFADNGGQMSVPGYVTPTFTGLAAAGLTFVGAKYGLGSAGGPLKAATALSGTMGALSGTEINTRRLMTDLGIMGDPRTGRKGDWTLDAMANSWYGSAKSWPVNAPQAIYNEKVRSRDFDKMRTPIVKNLMDAIRTGRDSEAKAQLGALYKNHLQQWGNAEKGRQKFFQQMQSLQKTLSVMPQYSGMSQEYLSTKIMGLLESYDELTKIERQQLVEMQSVLQMKWMQAAKELKVVR